MSDLDDTLEQELRFAATGRGDGVPPLTLAAARSAFTWRTVDDELARLGYDSALDSGALAGVRGDEARLLTFEAPDLAIDVEVSESVAGRSVLGQASGQIERLQLQRPERDRSADLDVDLDVDATGSFRAEGLAPGPVRFRCLLATGGNPRIVSTEWVTI